MIEKVITDNPNEKQTVQWNDVRFAIIRRRFGWEIGHTTDVVLLNPEEMTDLISFAAPLVKES